MSSRCYSFSFEPLNPEWLTVGRNSLSALCVCNNVCAHNREKKRVCPCLHQQLKPSFHRLSTPQYCTLLSLRPISFPIFCLHRATVSPGWPVTLPLISLCLPAAFLLAFSQSACYALSDWFIHSGSVTQLYLWLAFLSAHFMSLKILRVTLKIGFPSKKFQTRSSQEYISGYIILKTYVCSFFCMQ